MELEEPAEFKASRSTVDHLFSLSQIVEKKAYNLKRDSREKSVET